MSATAHLATVPTFRLRLPAIPSSASVLRTRVQEWLSELDVAGGEILDLQLACSEAFTIVVEHGGRPLALIVDVDGTLQGEMVTFAFREYGLCRDAGPDTVSMGCPPLALALIEAMTDTFSVHAHADGSTITLSRRVQPGSHRDRMRSRYTASIRTLSGGAATQLDPSAAPGAAATDTPSQLGPLELLPPV